MAEEPKRFPWSLLACAALLAAIGVGWLLQPDLRPPNLPHAADIRKVTASMDYRPGTWAATGSSGPLGEYVYPPITFVFSPEYVPRLVELLRKGRVDPFPAKWMYMATVDVERGDGVTTHVDLFFGDGTRGAFRVGHTYYRGATDAEFERLLDEACFASQKHPSGPRP